MTDERAEYDREIPQKHDVLLLVFAVTALIILAASATATVVGWLL